MEVEIDTEALEEAKRPKRGNPNFGNKKMAEIEEKQPNTQIEKTNKEKELVCCLRNERVIARYIIRPSSNITNTRHVLYGGMADGAVRTFVVPKRTDGLYVNVLTDSEKDYLENVMGLEPNAMSVYKKVDNFWDDSNPNGINTVRLTKQDNYFNLASPEDYIKYKILLANNQFICKSLKELQDRPKATYQFVMVSEEGQTEMDQMNMTDMMRAYREFGKIDTNADVLSLIIEQMTGKPFVSGHAKIVHLQTKVNELIQGNKKMFLQLVTDPHLMTNVLIKKAIDAGVISKKNDLLYYRKENLPLCEHGQEATKSIAAIFLDNPKNQDLRFTIEAEVKEKELVN